MKAQIKDDLLDVIDDFFDGKEGHRTDPQFLSLCDRIAGETVDLVFVGQDAFEAEDRNYWLPDCCWREVRE